MFTKCYASALVGIEAMTVEVEVNITPGLGMFLVGLPDNAVRESQERIRSAFDNSGLKMPGKKVVVNLAPADVRKEGSSLDLTIAVAILAAAGQVAPDRLGSYIIMGELSLDGTVKPIRGALPIAVNARRNGFRGFILPRENAAEAAVAEGLETIAAGSLKEVVDFLNGDAAVPPYVHETTGGDGAESPYEEDFADVKGQAHVKRALEVAAAGGHNVIMIGSPGSGKTMLARRMPTIMPPMTTAESLETTKIHSVAGKIGLDTSLMTQRPFRSPHHTISNVAMVGGGAFPQPGEISLAHNGILFLDELPEFNRSVLEVMRQPLEDRTITVSRARLSVDYPANFMLVASMNPCPCGYYNHPDRPCLCSPGAVQKYMNRVSGPLLDRIDIQVEVVPVPFEKISDGRPSECSEAIRERVMKARAIQEKRFAAHEGIYSNAQMTSKLLHEYAVPDAAGLSLLKVAMQRLNLSARAYDRILKVSRTIADLEASPNIEARHLAEAIQYRSLDRETWGT